MNSGHARASPCRPAQKRARGMHQQFARCHSGWGGISKPATRVARDGRVRRPGEHCRCTVRTGSVAGDGDERDEIGEQPGGSCSGWPRPRSVRERDSVRRAVRATRRPAALTVGDERRQQKAAKVVMPVGDDAARRSDRRNRGRRPESSRRGSGGCRHLRRAVPRGNVACREGVARASSVRGRCRQVGP